MALPSDERQRPWQLDLVAHINNSLQVDGTMLADVWNQVITEGGTRPKDIFNTDLDPRHLKIEERGTHLLLQYDHANLLEESITKEGSEADEADEAEVDCMLIKYALTSHLTINKQPHRHYPTNLFPSRWMRSLRQ